MTHRFKDFKIVIFLSILLSVSLILHGCAKTVTQRDLGDLELFFNIEFESTPNNNYCTYIIFSETQNTIRFEAGIPFYLTAPGQDFDETAVDAYSNQSGITTYYSEYFDTWDHFMILTPSSADLFNGPFSITDKEDHFDFQRNFFYGDQLDGSQYELRINISRLNLSEGDDLYFQIITVDNSNLDQSGIIQDALVTEGYINLSDQNTNDIRSNDTTRTPASGSATIKSWSISVQ